MSEPVHVEVHELLTPGLHRDWVRLVERAGWVTPFEHPDWAETAIAMSEGESCPLILAAREGRAGELRGILSLGRLEQKVGPLRLATLRSLSLHRHDLTTVVADAEWRGRVEESFAAELTRLRRKGTQIRVRGIPASASLLNWLGEEWQHELPSPLRVADLRGMGGWREVIRDGHQRRELERVGRKLAREHSSEVRWAESGEEARILFGQFLALHRAQMVARQRDDHFVDRQVVGALEARFAEWVPRGLADVGVLRVGEQAIAGYLLMHVPRYTWAYRTTFALDWSRYAPGALMLTAAIDRAIGRGSERYDFGWGDQRYKRDWSVVIDQVIQLSALGRFRRLPFRILPQLGVPVHQVCSEK